jgi:hypothetical protein
MTINSDKIFAIALITSVAVHGVVLVQHSGLSIFSNQKKEQKTEISYFKPVEDPKVNLKPPPQIKDREEFLNLPSKIIANNRLKPQYESMPVSPDLKRPVFIKPDIIAIKKKITLPPIDINKINSPSYISYYQIVREKIRRAAYQNYSRTETGEAYVSFVIARNGIMKEAHLVESKSSLSPYLRGIAMKSIQEAIPFPDFPKELDYPQLSFNVIISFEIE